jgi:7,8-dihydro-6-hydroxymethylpterin-pyrophosphokinase
MMLRKAEHMCTARERETCNSSPMACNTWASKQGEREREREREREEREQVRIIEADIVAVSRGRKRESTRENPKS